MIVVCGEPSGRRAKAQKNSSRASLRLVATGAGCIPLSRRNRSQKERPLGARSMLFFRERVWPPSLGRASLRPVCGFGVGTPKPTGGAANNADRRVRTGCRSGNEQSRHGRKPQTRIPKTARSVQNRIGKAVVFRNPPSKQGISRFWVLRGHHTPTGGCVYSTFKKPRV